MDIKVAEEAIKEIEKIGLVPYLKNLEAAASIQQIYWQTVVADLKTVIKRLEGE